MAIYVRSLSTLPAACEDSETQSFQDLLTRRHTGARVLAELTFGMYRFAELLGCELLVRVDYSTVVVVACPDQFTAIHSRLSATDQVMLLSYPSRFTYCTYPETEIYENATPFLFSGAEFSTIIGDVASLPYIALGRRRLVFGQATRNPGHDCVFVRQVTGC